MIEGFTNFWEDEFYDHTFRNLAAPAIVTMFVGLFTAAPGEAGGGTEVTGGAYARQSVAFGAPTDGAGSNTALISFPKATAPNWGLITHWALFDAVTAGNMIAYGPLAGAKKIAQGEAVGDLLHSETHGLANDDIVVLRAIIGNALPAGLSADVKYFVVGVAGSDFQVSLTQGGAAVTITADGIAQFALNKERTINIDDTFEFPIGNINVAVR